MLKRNFLWLLLSAVIAAAIYFFRNSWFFGLQIINLLPLIALFFLGCMYNSLDLHYKKLKRPVRYLFPLYIFISISFGIISLIFGIHTEVFTSYDTSSGNKRDEFKWFKSSQILNFPVNQIQNRQQVPSTEVDFNNIQDSINTCHIIVVDFTKSVADVGNEINDSLRAKIKTVYSDVDNRLDTLETQYLIAPFLISGIYHNQTLYPNEAISVFFYDGINHGDMIRMVNISSTKNRNNYSFSPAQIRDYEFLTDYFILIDTLKARRALSKARVETNINDIIEAVHVKLNGGENEKIDEFQFNRCCKNSTSLNAKFERYKLSIVSDFINTDSTVKSNDISSISRLNELRCYKLPGNENSNKTYTADMLIENLLHHFKSANESPVIDFNISDKQRVEQLYRKLSLANYQRKNEIGKNNMNFYFPYQSFNREKSIRLTLAISDGSITPKTPSKFFIRMWNQNNNEDRQNYIVRTSNNPENRKKTVEFDYIYPVTLNPATDSIILEFENESSIQNKEIVLELSSENSQKTRSFSVTLLPRMSSTTCYYLILCYSVFLFCLSLILILPNLFVLILIKKSNEPPTKYEKLKIKANKILLVLPIGFGIFIGFLPFIYLSTPYFNSIYLSFILLFILLFTLPHYLYLLMESKKNDDFRFNGLLIYSHIFTSLRKSASERKHLEQI